MCIKEEAVLTPTGVQWGWVPCPTVPKAGDTPKTQRVEVGRDPK